MVEMSETANILNNATSRSLVILDEIGRGTSTYDGIAIAWSVAEYLLTRKRAKTLFATHYFELTELQQEIPGAVNYNVAVHESEKGDHFSSQDCLKAALIKATASMSPNSQDFPPLSFKKAEEILHKLHADRGQTSKPEGQTACSLLT